MQDPAHAPRRPGPATVCCSVVTVNRDQHRELLRTFLNRRNSPGEIQKFRRDPASISEETKLPSMLPTIYIASSRLFVQITVPNIKFHPILLQITYAVWPKQDQPDLRGSSANQFPNRCIICTFFSSFQWSTEARICACFSAPTLQGEMMI